jgi:hypothetical protein
MFFLQRSFDRKISLLTNQTHNHNKNSTMTMRKGHHRLLTPRLVLLTACSLAQLTLSFAFSTPVRRSFLSSIRLQPPTTLPMSMSSSVTSSSSSSTITLPSWSTLQEQSKATNVGKALTKEIQLRELGLGSAARENTLRKFDSPPDTEPQVTLFR